MSQRNRFLSTPDQQVSHKIQQQHKNHKIHRSIDSSSKENDLNNPTTSSINKKASERVFISKTWSIETTFIVTKNGGAFEIIQFTKHAQKTWSFGVNISNARKMLKTFSKMLTRASMIKRNISLEDLMLASREQNGDIRLHINNRPIKRKIFRFNNIEMGMDSLSYSTDDGNHKVYDGFFIRRYVGDLKMSNSSQGESSATSKHNYLGIQMPLKHLEPLLTALTFVLRRRWRSLDFPESPFTTAMRRACAIEKLMDQAETSQSKADKRSQSWPTAKLPITSDRPQFNILCQSNPDQPTDHEHPRPAHRPHSDPVSHHLVSAPGRNGRDGLGLYYLGILSHNCKSPNILSIFFPRKNVKTPTLQSLISQGSNVWCLVFGPQAR